MILSQNEYEIIMSDTSKRIDENISWKVSASHDHAQEFRKNILSELECSLFVNGWWSPLTRKLSYTLILESAGRILGLDIGDYVHHNPTCQSIRGPHIHRWNENHKDKIADSAPNTKSWQQPIEAWDQFCCLAVIEHRGKMIEPILQERLFL